MMAFGAGFGAGGRSGRAQEARGARSRLGPRPAAIVEGVVARALPGAGCRGCRGVFAAMRPCWAEVTRKPHWRHWNDSHPTWWCST